jgi:cytochrome c biogenesis protein CcdA
MKTFLRQLLRAFGWLVLVACLCAVVSAIALAVLGAHLNVSLGNDMHQLVSDLGTTQWLLVMGALALAWSITLVAVPLSLAVAALMVVLALAWACAPLIALLALVGWLVRRARRRAEPSPIAS